MFPTGMGFDALAFMKVSIHLPYRTNRVIVLEGEESVI